jgi:hypothetical protein
MTHDVDPHDSDHDSDLNPAPSDDPGNPDFDPELDPENSDPVDPGNSDLDQGNSDLDPENSDHDEEPSDFDPGNPDLDPENSDSVDPGNSDLDSEPSDFDPGTFDLDPELNPGLETRQLDEGSDDNSESDVDAHESMEVDSILFEPLYDSANITVCGAYCAIMEFKRVCKLPFSAILMLLQLLQLLCPSGSKLPRSIYILKKFFRKHSSRHKRKLFCPDCQTELTGKQQKCTNAGCQGKEPNYLITLKPDRAISNILRSKKVKEYV